MNLTFLLSAGSERDTNFQCFRLQNPFGGNESFDGTLIFRLLYNLKQFQGEIRQNCFKEEAQLVVRLPCSTNHIFHLFFFAPPLHILSTQNCQIQGLNLNLTGERILNTFSQSLDQLILLNGTAAIEYVEKCFQKEAFVIRICFNFGLLKIN